MDFETVTIKADIDDKGNGAFPSNSNIVSHDGVPLRDFIKQKVLLKPEGLNDKGVVLLPDHSNPFDLSLSGIYTCAKWLDDTLPFNATICTVELKTTYSNSYKTLIVDYPSRAQRFINFNNGGVWQGWKSVTETHAGVTLMNEWISNGHLPILTKINDIVWLNAIVRNGTNTKDIIMMTIPDGYRPHYGMNVVSNSLEGNGLVSIEVDGSVVIYIATPDKNNVQITSMWSTKA